MFETCLSAIIDEFPHVLRKRRVLVAAVACLIEFLLGLPLITQVTECTLNTCTLNPPLGKKKKAVAIDNRLSVAIFAIDNRLSVAISL